jgi:hypothetical protein
MTAGADPVWRERGPRFATELTSPWRARLAAGLVERYGDRDLTELHYAELDRLSGRLHRIVGDDAEPFEPEELAQLPLQSTGRVECLHDRVCREMCLRNGFFVTIGGRTFVRAWWRRPEDARHFLRELEARRRRSLHEVRPSRLAPRSARLLRRERGRDPRPRPRPRSDGGVRDRPRPSAGGDDDDADPARRARARLLVDPADRRLPRAPSPTAPPREGGAGRSRAA